MTADVSMKDRIAKKAYELYVKRGKKEGNAIGDWLAAEKEVMREIGQAAPQQNVRTEPAAFKDKPAGERQSNNRRMAYVA